MEKDVDLRSLVERAKTRDADALAQLYEIYFAQIYRYALASLGTHHEAEDVASQTFVKMLEAIDRFSWQGSGFSAWLFRIAHNAVMDRFRSGKRDVERTSQLAANISPTGEPGQMAARNAELRELLTELKGLTTEQRQVLLLRFLGGVSTSELATIMGKTEANVRTIQHRALVALRNRLQVKIGD